MRDWIHSDAPDSHEMNLGEPAPASAPEPLRYSVVFAPLKAWDADWPFPFLVQCSCGHNSRYIREDQAESAYAFHLSGEHYGQKAERVSPATFAVIETQRRNNRAPEPAPVVPGESVIERVHAARKAFHESNRGKLAALVISRHLLNDLIQTLLEGEKTLDVRGSFACTVMGLPTFVIEHPDVLEVVER